VRWLFFIAAVAGAAERGYIAPALCQKCHTAIYDSYSRTGMARTFSLATNVPSLDGFVHDASRRIYRTAVRSDGVYIQRMEFGGANFLEKRIDFAIGSGVHSRTYVARTAGGRLIELPVSWYAAEGGRWAMSPGYDRPGHSDFRREITESCLFCHNGYPSEANAGLASGIDCQRCHGPGEDHATRGAPMLNPAKLSPERRLEVCLQCHLESASRTLPDAVRRFGRATFSYRPGEPLASWQLYFDFVRPASNDRITVNNSGYGLMRSQCFLRSGGRLTCTSCHDPHRAETEDVTRTCRSCHASVHTPATPACAGCHMPRRRTEDAVHVIMTDHFIRKRGVKNDTAPIAEQHDRQIGPVRPLYPARLSDSPEDNLYLAIATVRSSANPRVDVQKLEAAIAASNPSAPEPFIELGNATRALEPYRQALNRGSRDAHVYVAIGELLMQAGRTAEAIRLLEMSPLDVAARNALAVAYGSQYRFASADRLLEKTIQLNPDEPLTWLNLGVARQALGQKARAEAAYREGIRLQPDLTRARQYLEALLKN
jgi:hypothetical protein